MCNISKELIGVPEGKAIKIGLAVDGEPLGELIKDP